MFVQFIQLYEGQKFSYFDRQRQCQFIMLKIEANFQFRFDNLLYLSIVKKLGTVIHRRHKSKSKLNI